MTHRGAELQDVANVPLLFLVAAAAAYTDCTHCLQSVGDCKTSILPAKTAHAGLLRPESYCSLRRRQRYFALGTRRSLDLQQPPSLAGSWLPAPQKVMRNP